MRRRRFHGLLRRLPAGLRWGTAFLVSLSVAGIIALGAVGYVTAQRQAHEALSARADTAARSTRRIDQLSGQIGQLQATAQQDASRIGQLITQVGALEEQIRQMCVGHSGCAPVVIEPNETTTTTATTTTRPVSVPSLPPSTTTTTRPAPTTTTTTTTAPHPGCIPILGCPGGPQL